MGSKTNTPSSTMWVCDQDCGEPPWVNGEGEGLALLQQGEECTCGGNYGPTAKSGWAWSELEKRWVWRDPALARGKATIQREGMEGAPFVDPTRIAQVLQALPLDPKADQRFAEVAAKKTAGWTSKPLKAR